MWKKFLILSIPVYCFLSGQNYGVNLHLGKERLVCRVWPFLTISRELQWSISQGRFQKLAYEGAAGLIFPSTCCPRNGMAEIFENKYPKSTVSYKICQRNKWKKLLFLYLPVYCFLGGQNYDVSLHLVNERPVWRVWPFLTRSWEWQRSIFQGRERKSANQGAAGVKLFSNCCSRSSMVQIFEK